MIFPVVMYRCESWTIMKAEHWRTDALELWCWRRLLRAPWIARRSNQSILKEISPEYSLERLMLKLNLQYFGPLIWRMNSFKKTLMLGTIEGRRRRGWQRMRLLDGLTDSVDMNLSELQELVIHREAWHAAGHGVAKSQTLLSNWAEQNILQSIVLCIITAFILASGHTRLGIKILYFSVLYSRGHKTQPLGVGHTCNSVHRMWTDLRDWTCKYTFASLKGHDLKVYM